MSATKSRWLPRLLVNSEPPAEHRFEDDDGVVEVQALDMEQLARRCELARNNVVDKQAELEKAKLLQERTDAEFIEASKKRGLPCRTTS